MELPGALLLLAASAFFSGSETALYRANWVRLTHLARERVAGAGLALRLADRREETVVTILIGNNLVNTFISVLVTRAFAIGLGPAWTALAVVIVAVVTFVFGEYAPKTFAHARPTGWSRRAALPLAACRYLFAPAVLLVGGLTRLLGATLAHRARPTVTRDDFLAAARLRSENSSTRALRTDRLVARLLRFSNMKVAELAIPLARVRSVPLDAGRDAAVAVSRRYGYSRIPVHRGDPADLVGVVVVKDLLSSSDFRVRHLGRVPETGRALEVLRGLQQRGEHLAAVTDASGRVTGIVTLEDLLEELVGEIRSEA